MVLGSRKKNKMEDNTKEIEISAQMQGSLKFNDPVNLKINGNYKGDLDAKGTLTIGENANVEANIKGDNVIIAGRVVGDIKAKKMLVLMEKANVLGNISTPKINIVEGLFFKGIVICEGTIFWI